MEQSCGARVKGHFTNILSVRACGHLIYFRSIGTGVQAQRTGSGERNILYDWSATLMSIYMVKRPYLERVDSDDWHNPKKGARNWASPEESECSHRQRVALSLSVSCTENSHIDLWAEYWIPIPSGIESRAARDIDWPCNEIADRYMNAHSLMHSSTSSTE